MMGRSAVGGLMISAAALVALTNGASAFAPVPSAPFTRRCAAGPAPSSTGLYMGMNRKARRQQQKEQGKISSKKLLNALDDAGGKKKGKKGKKSSGEIALPEDEMEEKRSAIDAEMAGERVESELGGEGESVVSGAAMVDALPEDEDMRPEVSAVVMDEDTGILRVVQGKNVRDIVTGKAVKLSDKGPEYRLAQMFPGAPPDVREKYRFDWKSANVAQMVESLQEASMVTAKNEAGNEVVRIPPHPQIANSGIDFVLANRDYLGFKMNKLLGRLKLRAQSEFKKDDALTYRKLWKNYLTVERHISAPFRQIMLDAEKKVGPNFGNNDLMSYCNGEVYERAGSYLVLKSMVAHWQQKVQDAEYVESTPETSDNTLEVLMVGDPKRYLPDPPIIFRLDECQRIAQAAANMTAIFVLTPELYDDLPLEIKFVEEALRIQTGTEMRKFVVEDFCPREGCTPESLREGVRRLAVQLDSMQIDPYGDLRNTVVRLCDAMAVGTDDEKDPYQPFLVNFKNGYDNPGFFQTYTFDHDKLSLVAFLDNPTEELEEGKIQGDDLIEQLGKDAQRNLMGFMGAVQTVGKEDDDLSAQVKKKEYEPYQVPETRALGRPHMMGWLELLEDEERFGGEGGDKSKDDEQSFESDNWREVSKST
eukprot:CAMPEP_0113570576 /NCGR_PEP_ID=MMETSP0015_2-20120614/25056_1 /TAXON_ID=2838 /ORGANISM="Odontella" /LENGTH=647 /DNA_ID=CAMNT_0000473393 /DNA_START=8 /DNA_END=1951 /DNA_ORIENTATION=- /assembly_acc=CAM_ASM_000160